ncbi:unnamed protein product [Rhizoctonia solani]|uniref:ferric-chelate reductase (NADPH) n=1 Tax=Rhizoctonia solani TaxID=456999 RepID=A0A8H3AFD8_9AGAM|nr:unnamed protein product [Rhizoctonia solani]
MEGNNNLTYLLPATSGEPSPVARLPFPPDYMFSLGYEIFIVSGIGILMLFMFPQIICFGGSRRQHGGRWFHQSERLDSPMGNMPAIHITRSKAELIDGEMGTNIISPKVHRVTFPGLYLTASDDGSSGLSRKDEHIEKVQTNKFAGRTIIRPLLSQRQGIAAAYMGWAGAKMSKFIGGPVGMHFGPWLIVLAINVMANVLILLAPPFFVAPDRPAHIAVAQIPILFVLGTKNNILSYMLGRSYEKLNFVHRTVGRLLFVCATLHVVGQFIKYSTHGVLGQAMGVPWVQAGLAAWIGLILVTFASVGIVRIKFYDFFLNSHMIGIFVFMVAIHFHMLAVVAPYTLSGLAFYLIDLVLRACKVRIRPATISAIDDQMTLIAVRDIDDGWKAGQHVWVRILQGDRSWESHPFTIANAPASHTLDTRNSQGHPSRGLLLYARVAGNFTRALNLEARQGSGIQTNVVVDGPYGGLGAGTVEPADYRNVILVAGGGGASLTIALLEDLVSRSLEQKAHTKVVDFIWIVKEYAHLNWYMSTIKWAILAANSSAISLRVCLFVTQLETAPNGKLDRPLPPLPSQSVLDPEDFSTMDIIFKRPDVPTLVSEAISYAALAGQSSAGGGGVLISACGPASMTRDVQLATRRISIKDRRLAGGVSLHTEAFGL